MPDETPITPGAEAAPEPPTLVQRFEEDVHEAEAAIEAIPEKAVDKVHEAEAAIETFWRDFVANASPQVPTSIHNYVQGSLEGLKAKIKSLF